MDLKSLIAKMDQIESKKFLTESEKKETSWTDMKGNKHGATKVKGKSYGNQPEPKEVDNEGKPKKVKEGLNIADALMEEFGIKERVTINPDGTTSGGLRPQPAANWQKDVTIDGMTSDGRFKFSPEQEKWLGGADRQDPNILARMPGPKPPVSYFKDPAAQARARELNFGQQNLNAVKKAVGANQEPAQTFAEPSRQGTPASQSAQPAPQATTPAKAPTQPQATNQNVNPDSEQGQMLAKQTAGMNEPSSGVAGVQGGSQQDNMLAAQTAGMEKPAAQQSAQQATKWPTTRDEIMAFQKANGLKADGLIGNQTMAALQKAGATPPAGFKPVGNKAPAQQSTQPAAQPQATQADVRKVDNQIAAASSGAKNIPPNADKKVPYWVNGTRYEFRTVRGGGGQWVATATPQDKLQWNSTRARSMSSYTGPDNQFDQWRQAQRAGSNATASAPAAQQSAQPAVTKEELNFLKKLAGI